MTMRASQRKLLQLEAQVNRMVKDCWDRAWQRLSYVEQDQLFLLFEEYGVQVSQVSAEKVRAMERPEWATPAQWAALNRYAEYYFTLHHREMGHDEADV